MTTVFKAAALASLLSVSSAAAQGTASGGAEDKALEEQVSKLLEGAQPPSSEIEARAKAAAEKGRARERSLEAEAYSRALRETLGLMEDGTNAGVDTPPDNHRHVPTTTVAFVSSSMPLAMLRAYAEQLEKVGGHLVLRGVPGGMEQISPFIRFSMDILKVDPSCDALDCETRSVGILIDPILFRSYGVKAVPSVALIKADLFEAYCERDEEAPRIAAVSSGDVHLTAHLEELARLGQPEAKAVLAAYHEGETQ
jgi:type-F conjugative transfer system pilin assembly protein TrbC